jgi:demethylmenaquinone methyltransferase/2-methoxy-6-polyprenyl-1,4-benzoquinol methylase
MMSVVFMRVLESAPSRYDRGIRLLTLGRADRLYDWLAAHTQSGWRVLDLGAGTAALALRAASRGAEVVAIDVNPAMLDIARRRARAAGLEERIRWREMGVAEMDDFPDRAFDAISAGLCFSELGRDERRYALRQARRILRPEGRLLLLDEIRPDSPLHRLLYAVVRIPLVALTWLLTQTSTHPLPDLGVLLEQLGFEVVEQRTALFGSLVAVVARPPAEEG